MEHLLNGLCSIDAPEYYGCYCAKHSVIHADYATNSNIVLSTAVMQAVCCLCCLAWHMPLNPCDLSGTIAANWLL